jgi:hypothetical protein
MASDEVLAAATTTPQEFRFWHLRSSWRYLRTRMTKRLAATIIIWRIEARLATPLALLLVATLGRWPAALTMGTIMACFSALFLFLLDGERVMHELRGWLEERRMFRRYLQPIADRQGFVGTLHRALAIPVTIMFMGPFFRATTYHLFRMRPVPAYTLSVLGSYPHSLLWTGIVAGGFWDWVLEPAFSRLWEAALSPLIDTIV